MNINGKEIQQISETEFMFEGNRSTIINGNTIYVIAYGEHTTEIAVIHRKICEMLATHIQGKVNYLIDLNKCGKNSPEARNIWKEMSEYENTLKVATYGLNPVARVIASFVIGTYKNSNLRFFKTKEEALDWLSK
ncbi:MAG: STAS/SEC14 domain-containing protein [Bacteroidales bacterium]|jgi:hypothetical protein